MSLNNVASATLGLLIILSIAFGAKDISPFFYDENWLYVGAIVGFNLFQSAFTGFCFLKSALKKLNIK